MAELPDVNRVEVRGHSFWVMLVHVAALNERRGVILCDQCGGVAVEVSADVPMPPDVLLQHIAGCRLARKEPHPHG